MNKEVFNAETKYGDLKGSISIDQQDNKSLLEDFLKESNVDLTQYNPIGIKFDYNNTLSPDGEDNIFSTIFIYAIDKKMDTEEIVKFSKDITIKDFFSFFKRFSLFVSNHGEYSSHEMNIMKVEKII